MNRGLQTTGAGGVEVVTAAQSKLIDRAKVYQEAYQTSIGQTKGYAYLCGKTLLALKETVKHGEFEALKEAQFPDSRSALGRFMQFAEAVDFAKNPTLGFLEDGQFLLALTPDKKAEVIYAVGEMTGEHGIVQTIAEWRRKLNPPHKSNAADRALEEKHDADEFAKTILGALNMAQSESGLERLQRCTDSLVQLIEEARIELGHALAPILKGRKAFKSSRK